jgi:predicted kinase
LAAGDDSLSRTKAWVKAINELRVVLTRPVEKNLYVTVGVPGSGKTTWASTLQASNKLQLIFDACSITKSDRYEILDIASAYTNIRRIAVLFKVSIDTALERNSFRGISTRVPDEKIRSMFSSIEYPEVFDSSEIFDEIIMVQS